MWSERVREKEREQENKTKHKKIEETFLEIG